MIKYFNYVYYLQLTEKTEVFIWIKASRVDMVDIVKIVFVKRDFR